MTRKLPIHYEFHSIRFSSSETGNLALTSGRITAKAVTGLFGLALSPGLDGTWLLNAAKSSDNIQEILGNPELLQQLVNKAAWLLKTINVWPAESDTKKGAKIVMNEILAPAEVANKVIISFRPNMLSLPTSNWKKMWQMIEGRIESDGFFSVQGFSNSEVATAVEELKSLFSGDWVRARYRKIVKSNNTPLMAADFPPELDNWFPAYHLARTALGAICIDPGWNYIIEIGLSIQELEGFVGLKDLKDQIVRSPGTQHHLCLAAELYSKGLLTALEPSTGSGNYTNDLLIKISNNEYHIEVKEFSSKNPGKQLKKQMNKKSKALPDTLNKAVIFHAVLVENGIFDKEKEDQFFREVQELKGSIPKKISAIVAGRRFVDSSGGRIKRDSKIRVLNPTALVPSEESDLAELFAQNYHEIKYPIFGVSSFFYFGTDYSKNRSTKQPPTLHR